MDIYTDHNDNNVISSALPAPRSLCTMCYSEDVNILHEIAQEMATSTAQQDVLRNILRILERRRELVNGTIMLLDADASTLIVEELGSDDTQHKRRISYKRNEGIVGRVLESRKPMIVPDINEEPLFKNRIHQRKAYETASFICVPILLGNEAFGVLSGDHKQMDIEQLRRLERLLTIAACMIAYDIRTRRIHRIEREALEAENKRLLSEIKADIYTGNMLGDSDEMRHVFSRIQQVAPSNITVLIRGESGTGKELAAAAIHYNSQCKDRPFVKVNCAALNEGLLESELFGHEKGAFTGALYQRSGRIMEAEGGTLFLDEIGDFSMAIQVKLLRVIQEREYERVGSNKTQKANVRIIAATNCDLEEAVGEGTFREDLYYRINVFPIYLPPLRNRRSDILLLANHFAQKVARQAQREVERISTSAINLLMSYHWPGNIRELENCMAHAVLMCNDGIIHGRHFPPTLQAPKRLASPGTGGTLKERTEMLERDMIIDALKRSSGSITKASVELGITDRMVRYKIQKLGIDYEQLFKRRKRGTRTSKNP